MSVQVKICGLKTQETIEAALQAGADFIGFVFFKPSPRHLDGALARELAAYVRGKAKIVALLVDPSDDFVDQVITNIHPDFLQLHGDETAERVEEIATKFKIDVIKALPVDCQADIKKADEYKAAKIILFDAKPDPESILPGGNGIAFNWTLLSDKENNHRFMLSGGLTPETVANAIEQTGCKMVDVSSGVEISSGVKDSSKISAFIRAAKQTN